MITCINFSGRFHRMLDRQAWAYLYRSFGGYFNPKLWRCPSCGGEKFDKVSRKSIVTLLVRCQTCQLLFRAPRDTTSENYEFYQHDYESGGLTTQCPAPALLDQLIRGGFRGSDKDFHGKIQLLKVLGIPNKSRVLDFGSSWGYVTWQLKEAGYDAVGYEISKPRASYGREHLGVDIETDLEELCGPFDVLFSSHALEHLPDPNVCFSLAKKILKKGGVFIAFTPNGSDARVANKKKYDHSWGRVHPVYLDEKFYQYRLPEMPKMFTSRNYGEWGNLDDIARWDQKTDYYSDLTLPEMVAIWINDPIEI